MNILLHICCGPCALFPVSRLQEQGHSLRGFFFNPNIHPFQEYQRRQEGVEQLAQTLELSVIYAPDYPLETYFREIAFRENQRCFFCYYLRLKRAAQVAKKGNFAAFTTSLLVSPYQKHDLVRQVGEQVAAEMDLPFYYADFRPGYSEGVTQSKALGMYRQPYCGCIFSEYQRFGPKTPKTPKIAKAPPKSAD